MTTEEKLDVISGKHNMMPIECRMKRMQNWLDCYHTDFNFQEWEYRIKPSPPKPRDWWIAYTPGIYPDMSPAYSEKPAWSPLNPSKTAIIHVREVLPDEGRTDG